MRATAILLTILVSLALCGSALAQSEDTARRAPLVLDEGLEHFPLGRYLEVLEDPGGELTIEDVTSAEYDAQFDPSEEDIPNFGYTDSAYWLRLPLRNESSQTEHWLLELAFASMNFVDLYAPSPDGEGFAVKQTGNLRPLETRDYRHPNIVFDLNIPAAQEQVVYLRFQNGSSMSLPLQLWRPIDFLTQSARVQAVHGVYFGIMIGLLGYNLFLLISLRDSSHLYLVTLLASMIVLEAAYLGYMEVYLAPTYYYLRQYYLALSFALVFVSMVLFADSFLELKLVHPRLHWVNLAIVGIWGVLIFLIPFTRYSVITSLMVPWALPSLLAVMAAGILTWRCGFRPARSS